MKVKGKRVIVCRGAEISVNTHLVVPLRRGEVIHRPRLVSDDGGGLEPGLEVAIQVGLLEPVVARAISPC